jgi:cytochrome c-type biogenesis protein
MLILPLLFFGAWGLVWGVGQFGQHPIYRTIEQSAFVLGEQYERWFSQQSVTNPLLLIGLAFAGGLVASISPCILSLLPVNLSYIGTREITSRREAFLKAGAFVLGVVTVLSLLGLFSSLAAFVFVQFQGYFYVLVGTIILLMGLNLTGLLPLSLPHLFRPNQAIGTSDQAGKAGSGFRKTSIKSLLAGPYGVGLTFALVSSPCTSPVMVAVLAAGAATGSQVQSTLTMVSYALGYTAIIFLASLFTGLAKQSRILLRHSETIVYVAGIVLLLVGAFYLINGSQWILLTLR